MFGLNQQTMQSMMWGFLSQQYNKLPDRVKQALFRLEVRIMKKSDRLVILVKANEGDEDAAKAGKNLIDQMYAFLPEYLKRSFKVRVSVYEEATEEGRG